MNIAFPSPRQLPSWLTLARFVAGLFVALVLALAGTRADAAPPPAGTSISNQASATYSDGSGVARTVTSNLVQTTVTQVYSLTLTANGAQNATPGSVVYYPHTLTNTGNGTDTFNLSAVNATGFVMGSIQIFADNGSGQPTGAAITSSGPVASNGTFRFIVQGTVPTTATPPATNQLTVTATSTGDVTRTASNTDTTTLTSNAVVTLTKAISASSGAPNSGPYTYTLTYTNTGNSNATAVAITDAIPAGMSYVAGSARWSVTGGTTALSDTGGSSGAGANTLTSTVTGGPTGPYTFQATIATVTPGQSGFLTFQVNVNAGVAPGVLTNTGTVSYNNGAATVSGSSNSVPFTVTQTANVTLTGQTIATAAAAGSTVTFTNVLTNTGNGTDTFNVTFAATNSFPAGTTFQLFRPDGTTPMVDTNGDGTEDTGPLAAGAVYNVIVRATLPPNASKATPSSIVKTARSVLDSTKFADATDTLNAITGASMDLTNNTSTGPGVGAGPEATRQVTNTTNPGTTTVFTLVASNKGPTPDTYNLAASTSSDFSTGLPTGWTVTFRADGGGGSCATTGATITNTGTVAATTGTATVCAVVTIPAGYDAGTTSLYFRALSPTSGAGDRLHDGVTVNAVRSVSLTPNGTGQTYPGGSFVYTHTLTNNGNVAEGTTNSTLTPALVNDGSGWTATLYIDSNSNGVLDAADVLVSGSLNAVLPTGLAKGQAVTLFNRVIAPSGAVPGTVNTTTITVTTVNGTYTTTAPAPTVATDSTTVIAGNLTLVKTQALDAACDGTADGVYSQAGLNARPGECVLYRITVTNVGAANATNVVVSDATPSYTTISTTASTTAPNFASGPAIGASGTVTGYIGDTATASSGGTLAPGASAVITFGVRITP